VSRRTLPSFLPGESSGRTILAVGLCGSRQPFNELQARADRADSGLLDNDDPQDDLKEQFLKHRRQALKPTSTERYRGSLRRILPRLGANRASQVNFENVLTYRGERLAEGASPRTVDMEVGALATMLRWGVKHRLLGSNPLAAIKPLPHDHPKKGRPLSRDEVERLIKSSPRHWREIWYAILVSGVRKEKLASLTSRDIERESREPVVRSGVAKNHTARRIPIEGGLWEFLRRREADRKDRVECFGKTAGLTRRSGPGSAGTTSSSARRTRP
jgi:integrase